MIIPTMSIYVRKVTQVRFDGSFMPTGDELKEMITKIHLRAFKCG